MTDPCFAVPFLPYPEKLTRVLDALCEHRTWFPDDLWHDPVVRRVAASRRLVEWMTDGVVWEAWRGDALVGILGVDRIVPKHEAYCHFVFFDRHLADKADLCLSQMAWCFADSGLDLHILRVEIPTYARALAGFARRKLGFRYEAEDRQLSWPSSTRLTAKEAEAGSRKYHGQRYEGTWHDQLLLSITREEFHGSTGQTVPSQHRPDAGAPATDQQLPDGASDRPDTGDAS